MTNMTDEELIQNIVLKPCPFCGGTGELMRGLFDGWSIYCNRCPAVMHGEEHTSNPQKIADKWNRRVEHDAE